MLVLVATNELQGTADGDYSCTVEGELVTPVVAECSSPVRCGCNMGFPGLASSRAVTTAMVADLPHISEAQLRDAVEDSLERDGWFELVGEACRHDLVDEHLECIAAVCAAFPVGTVVGRNGTEVFSRSPELPDLSAA
jgi:hypothetical protein